MAMLEVKDLEVYYGVIQALKGISFSDQGVFTIRSSPFSTWPAAPSTI